MGGPGVSTVPSACCILLPLKFSCSYASRPRDHVQCAAPWSVCKDPNRLPGFSTLEYQCLKCELFVGFDAGYGIPSFVQQRMKNGFSPMSLQTHLLLCDLALLRCLSK